jgi:hypothetical protein
MSTNRKNTNVLGNTIDGNIFNKHNDQEKKTLVKRLKNSGSGRTELSSSVFRNKN